MDELIKWLGTVAAACIAAYIGSLIALSKAKKEKMWTQKQDAYLNIIESLHNLIIWADEEYAANFPHPLPTVGEDKLKELRRNQGKAIDILRKHVHLGELIVSKDASEKLELLLSEYFSAEGDFFFDFIGDERSEEVSKHYERLREIVEKHIVEVKRIARQDLGL